MKPPTADTAPLNETGESRHVHCVDSSLLQQLLGYNARRAALVIIEKFVQRMADFPLRPVDFSVMSLVTHNPGITSRQLCTALGLLPPNLVGLLNQLEKRGWILRQPHPTDRRAVGIYASPTGKQAMETAEKMAIEVELEAAPALAATEREELIRLLQKIYLHDTERP